MRTQKTVDGVTTEYYTVGGKLLAEKTGDQVLTFHYDEKGTPYALELNGTRYYYRYSLQGDVIGLYSTTGAVVAEYTYDPWGKLLSVTDTSGTDIGTINPLRYRGYYYDTETGFYFLQSRYYDPTVGRFINADEYVSTEQGISSYNMFAYCLNDPINRFDDNGDWSIPNWAKVSIGAVALAGAIALTVATGGGAAAVIVGVMKVVGSVALSTAVSAGAGYLENGKQGAIDGACNGFMFGSLSACGGAALKFAHVRAATTGSPNSIGKTGERLAGIDQSAKNPIKVNGRTRIPDALTDTTLTEVKNVRYISNTRQLRDFATYAKSTGRSLELWIRPTTRVAKTVINAGWHLNYLW